MTQKRNLALKALLLALFVSATPQAKPEWFSPKVKAIGGGIATVACATTAVICYKKLQRINKILNDSRTLKNLSEKEIQNLENKRKWYQVGMWGGAAGAIPCAMITGIGINEWRNSTSNRDDDYNIKDGIPHIFKVEKTKDGYQVKIGFKEKKEGKVGAAKKFLIDEAGFKNLLNRYKECGAYIKERIKDKEVSEMYNGFTNFITKMIKTVPGIIDKANKDASSLNDEDKIALISFHAFMEYEDDFFDDDNYGKSNSIIGNAAAFVNSKGPGVFFRFLHPEIYKKIKKYKYKKKKKYKKVIEKEKDKVIEEEKDDDSLDETALEKDLESVEFGE